MTVPKIQKKNQNISLLEDDVARLSSFIKRKLEHSPMGLIVVEYFLNEYNIYKREFEAVNHLDKIAKQKGLPKIGLKDDPKGKRDRFYVNLKGINKKLSEANLEYFIGKRKDKKGKWEYKITIDTEKRKTMLHSLINHSKVAPGISKLNKSDIRIVRNILYQLENKGMNADEILNKFGKAYSSLKICSAVKFIIDNFLVLGNDMLNLSQIYDYVEDHHNKEDDDDEFLSAVYHARRHFFDYNEDSTQMPFFGIAPYVNYNEFLGFYLIS